MRLEVRCEKCEQKLGEFELESAELAQAVIALLHCTVPHTGGHKLTARVQDEPLGTRGERRLKFVCLDSRCAGRVTELRCKDVEIGAVAVMYHSDHEGHSTDLWVDDRLVYKGMTT